MLTVCTESIDHRFLLDVCNLMLLPCRNLLLRLAKLLYIINKRAEVLACCRQWYSIKASMAHWIWFLCLCLLFHYPLVVSVRPSPKPYRHGAEGLVCVFPQYQKLFNNSPSTAYNSFLDWYLPSGSNFHHCQEAYQWGQLSSKSVEGTEM